MKTLVQHNTQTVLDFFQEAAIVSLEEWALDHRKLLKDLLEQFPSRPTAVVILHLTVREGIAKDILEAGEHLSVMMTERLIQFLISRTGITKDWATWGVSAWANALGTQAETKRRAIFFTPPKQQKRDKPLIRGKIGKLAELVGHRKAMTDLCFSPDGRWLASSSLDRSIRIWEASSGKLLTSFLAGHRDWIRTIDYQPNGAFLCSGGDDGTIRFWDMKKGRRLNRIKAHHGWVTKVRYSGDGSLLASGGIDGLVCIWQTESMEQIVKFGPFVGAVNDVVFDTAGEWLAVAYDNFVEIWGLYEKKRLARQHYQGECLSLLASPDGDILVGHTEGLEKRNPKNGEETLAFEAAKHIKHLILDPVSPSVIGAGKSHIFVWDIRAGSVLWTTKFKKDINGISLSRQGKLGVALSHSKGILLDMERFDQ